MTGAVGGVLRFGIGAAFKTGTKIGASDPRALGSTALVLALEVTGLTLPEEGGLKLAGVLGLTGKLEALLGATTASGVAALGFGVGVTTIGFNGGFSGLVGMTSGFAGLTPALELGFSSVLEICGLGALANVGSFGGVLGLGLGAALEAGGLTGLLEA